MRKLFILVFFAFIFSAGNASAASTPERAAVITNRTPVGMMVKGFFRKIFTGKEQMSEKKMKRILNRQK